MSPKKFPSREGAEPSRSEEQEVPTRELLTAQPKNDTPDEVRQVGADERIAEIRGKLGASQESLPSTKVGSGVASRMARRAGFTEANPPSAEGLYEQVLAEEPLPFEEDESAADTGAEQATGEFGAATHDLMPQAKVEEVPEKKEPRMSLEEMLERAKMRSQEQFGEKEQKAEEQPTQPEKEPTIKEKIATMLIRDVFPPQTPESIAEKVATQPDTDAKKHRTIIEGPLVKDSVIRTPVQEEVLSMIRNFDMIVGNIPQIELDGEFSFNTLNHNEEEVALTQDEIDRKREELKKDLGLTDVETQLRSWRDSLNKKRQQHYIERITNEMIGRKVKVGDAEYQIDGIGPTGGFSYGFYASPVKDGAGEEMFLKFINMNKAKVQDQNTQDILRQFTMQEINVMNQLGQLGYQHMPQLHGLLTFQHTEGAEDGSGFDEPIIRQTMHVGNVEVPTTFLGLKRESGVNEQDSYVSVEDIKVPDYFIVAMDRVEGGQTFLHAVRHATESQHNTQPDVQEYSPEKVQPILNAIALILQKDTFVSTEDQITDQKRLDEIDKTYQKNISFEKYKDLIFTMSGYIQIADELQGELGEDFSEHIAILKNEGARLYQELSRLQEGNFDVLSKKAAELVAAIEELHELGFVHKDLKNSNILSEQNHPMLIDYGLAERIPELLEKDMVLETIKDELVDYFVLFIRNAIHVKSGKSRSEQLQDFGGEENHFVAEFAQNISDYIDSQIAESEAGTHVLSLNLLKELQDMCEAIGREYYKSSPDQLGEFFRQGSVEAFLQSFYHQDHKLMEQAFPVTYAQNHGMFFEQEKAQNIFAAYQYLLDDAGQGKNPHGGYAQAAALAIANKMDYLGRGLMLGTPDKMYPPQMMEKSHLFHEFKRNIESQLQNILKAEVGGARQKASRLINANEVSVLFGAYTQIVDKKDIYNWQDIEVIHKLNMQLTELSANELERREDLQNQLTEAFGKLDLFGQDYPILKDYFIRKQAAMRTAEKYAAFPQRQADTYAGINIVLEMAANVMTDIEPYSEDRQGMYKTVMYPHLMDTALKEFSGQWYQAIREVMAQIPTMSSGAFLDDEVVKVFDCDGFRYADVAQEFAKNEQRQNLKELFYTQVDKMKDLTTADWILHNMCIRRLQEQTNRLYTEVESRFAEINEQNDIQTAVGYRAALAEREAFFLERVSDFSENLRQDFTQYKEDLQMLDLEEQQ